MYNRGFWDGYYLGRTMGEWNDSYGSKATEKKLYLGRGSSISNKIRVGEFRMGSPPRDDRVLLTSPQIG